MSAVRDQVAAVWTSPGSFATSLVLLFIDYFGVEAFDWEPETIRMEIRDTSGVDISDENMDKLLAMLSAITTNLFYVSMETFHHVCNALSGSVADFGTWDPLDLEEAAWGLTEVGLCDPPEANKPWQDRFSHEVRRYLGVLLTEEGVIHAPELLNLAERDSGPEASAESTFADDPAMLRAFYEDSRRKEKDIAEYLVTRLKSLLAQLETLPLSDAEARTAARAYAAKSKTALDKLTTKAESASRQA